MIDLKNDYTFGVQFREILLMFTDIFQLAQKINNLLPFAITYMCELYFLLKETVKIPGARTII